MQLSRIEESMAPVEPGAAAEEAYPSNFYAWYCVIVLFCIYINSFLDRQILSLLVQPIKANMSLSDTQISLLGGPAFGIFYVFAGLPLGWLADRMSRRLLVGVGQIFWSTATFTFGLSRTFGQMFAARVGVGTGEATLSPSAYSIISDLFPPNRLALALSVYGMGISVGTGLANLVGGYALGAMGVSTVKGAASVSYVLPWIGERQAWQVVFFVVALPTLPLTLLLLSVREPVRRGIQRARDSAGELHAVRVPLRVFVTYLRTHSYTILCHNLGFAFLSFSGYGAAFWAPAYYARIHGWELAFVGKALGWSTIVAGPAGALFGGWLADRLLERGYSDARVRVPLFAAVAALPFVILYPLMPTGFSAFLMMVPATFIGGSFWGNAPAAIQQLVPSPMRGRASAVYLFGVNLLGLTFGPTLLGMLTDYVFHDEMKVHYSLATVCASAHVVASVLLYLCLRSFRESLAATRSWRPDV